MDKEKQKLLLVAVSVGVFLAIAISVAVLFLMPIASEGAAYSSNRPVLAGQPPASVDSYDLVRSNENVLGLLPAPVATANQETNFYINGEPYASLSMESTSGENNSQVTINVPRPSAAAVPDTQVTNTQTARPPAQTAPAAAPAPAPAAVTSAPRAPASTPASSSPNTTAARPPAASSNTAPANNTANRNRIDYWVQTGSFTAKIRAENVKETLAAKGIVSLIENRDVNGSTWYRVRIGPYTSEAEANYWLALVKTIEGFSESQIWQTPSYR